MDMKVRSQTFHDVQLIKREKETRYIDVDHLVAEDDKGQEYWLAKRGLMNKEDGWAGRGDTVEIGGMKLKAVHNVETIDTKTEKALAIADACIWKVKLAFLGAYARTQNLMMGLFGG